MTPLEPTLLEIPEKIHCRRAKRGGENERENEWAALSAAHEKIGKIPETQIMVGVSGFEPETSSM